MADEPTQPPTAAELRELLEVLRSADGVNFGALAGAVEALLREAIDRLENGIDGGTF